MQNLTVKELINICNTHSIPILKKTKKDLIDILKMHMIDNKNIQITIDHLSDRFINTESFGITCEYIFCKIYNLKNNLESRIHTRSCSSLEQVLTEVKTKHNLNFIKYIGAQNKASDFIGAYDNDPNEYSISIKSTYSSNKICPANIGQCTKNKFIQNIYNQILSDNSTDTLSNDEIKSFIIKYIDKLINLYYENLFSSDILIYIKNIKQNISYQFITKKNKYKFDITQFTFTRTIDNWNESNTVKYMNKSIGEFQIHSNRNCIKFRFNTINLLSFMSLMEG